MKRLALVAALAGCGKTRVAECDALLATIEKIGKCEKLPAASRETLTAAGAMMKQALDSLEELGDRAPESQVEAITGNCKTQNKKIREQYAKVVPECLK